MMTIQRLGYGLLVALAASPTVAQTFTDNFNANPGGLNSVPAGWTVTGGTVDVIPTAIGQFDFLPGNGKYIDLDGSTSDAGLLARSMTLTGGTQYVASFFLAGNQRASTENVTVSFGSTTATYVLASSTPFTPYSLAFTPSVTGSVTLSFQNAGGDNIGALLDNVSVVPEPEPYGLALAGMGVVAFAMRRRQLKSS